MDAMDAILGRRSIRKYTTEMVAEDQVDLLIRAAMAAPSANNEQPWHFVVINERKMLDNLAEIHPYAKMLSHAPLAVLICGDLDLEKFPGYWVVDTSAACENLLIAAHALGLGAVWLGVYPRQERITSISQLLNLPERIIPLSLISIGHPAENKPPSERFNRERIRYNHWSNR